VLGRGAKRPLTLLGRYSDGVTRNLTSGSSGTVYSLTNAQPPTITVASVSANGVVTGNNPGNVTVVVANSSRSLTTTITVINAPNQAPLAEAPATSAGTAGRPMHISGESSFDPDLGPSALSYTWTQTGGSPLTVSGLTSPVLVVTPTVAGVYSVTLQVGDGVSTSQAIGVQVVVGLPAKHFDYLPLTIR